MNIYSPGIMPTSNSLPNMQVPDLLGQIQLGQIQHSQSNGSHEVGSHILVEWVHAICR